MTEVSPLLLPQPGRGEHEESPCPWVGGHDGWHRARWVCEDRHGAHKRCPIDLIGVCATATHTLPRCVSPAKCPVSFPHKQTPIGSGNGSEGPSCSSSGGVRHQGCSNSEPSDWWRHQLPSVATALFWVQNSKHSLPSWWR